MRRVAILLALLLVSPALVSLALVSPVAAHSLRVFARVEGAGVAGYGFFVGGGRPHGALWRARMGETVLATGETDAEGAFAFAVPRPVTDAVTVTLDTREGHVATATLAAARFGAHAAPAAPTAPAASAASAPAAAPPPAPDIAAPTAPTAPAASAANGPISGAAAPPIPSPSAPEVAALVEAAVAREVAPLLERIEAMDARLRFADILSGVFLILGLAGMGLWATGRRR